MGFAGTEKTRDPDSNPAGHVGVVFVLDGIAIVRKEIAKVVV